MSALVRPLRDLLDATRLVHGVPHRESFDRCQTCSKPWPCPWERARHALDYLDENPSLPGFGATP